MMNVKNRRKKLVRELKIQLVHTSSSSELLFHIFDKINIQKVRRANILCTFVGTTNAFALSMLLFYVYLGLRIH